MPDCLVGSWCAIPLGPNGWRGRVRRCSRPRDDAELEGLDADDAGRQLLLVWNVAGRSELELFDTGPADRTAVPGLPGPVVTGACSAATGGRVILQRRGAATARGSCGAWHAASRSGPGSPPALRTAAADPRRAGRWSPLPGPRRARADRRGCTGRRVAAGPGPAMLQPARRAGGAGTAGRSARSTRRWRPPGSRCSRRTSAARPGSAGPSSTPTTCTVGATPSTT